MKKWSHTRRRQWWRCRLEKSGSSTLWWYEPLVLMRWKQKYLISAAEFIRYSLPPAPCTLYPAPCTLHPAPCPLYPAPCTLPPAPCTLYPAPCTLPPVPCPLSPAPCTLPPVPCPLHPAPCPLPPAPCPLYPVPCPLYPAPLPPVPCPLYPAPCPLHPAPCTLPPVPCPLYPAPCTLPPVCSDQTSPHTWYSGHFPVAVNFVHMWRAIPSSECWVSYLSGAWKSPMFFHHTCTVARAYSVATVAQSFSSDMKLITTGD